jgi:hypothetical protein
MRQKSVHKTVRKIFESKRVLRTKEGIQTDPVETDSF